MIEGMNKGLDKALGLKKWTALSSCSPSAY